MKTMNSVLIIAAVCFLIFAIYQLLLSIVLTGIV